jgi:hypothetical protein
LDLLVTGGGADEKLAADVRWLRETLGLDPEAGAPRLVFGTLPRDKREIALLTRSLLGILGELS